VTIAGNTHCLARLTLDTGCTGGGSALCLLKSDYTLHGSPVALDRSFRTMTGEEGAQLIVKSDLIQVDGIDSPLESSYISYLDTPGGFRTFGLDGIHQLGVLMYNGLASIGANDQEAYSLWWNEFYKDSEDEDEDGGESADRGDSDDYRPISEHEWTAQFTAGSVRLSSRVC